MERITKKDLEKISNEKIRRSAFYLQETRLELLRKKETAGASWVSRQQLLLLTRFHNLYALVKLQSRKPEFKGGVAIQDLAYAIRLLDETTELIDADQRRSRFEIDNLRLLLEDLLKQSSEGKPAPELQEKLQGLFVFSEATAPAMPAQVPQRRKMYLGSHP